jgi:hypothetical protein
MYPSRRSSLPFPRPLRRRRVDASLSFKGSQTRHGARDGPAVRARLQDALLKGKRTGVTEIAGLGAFTWQEIVALADAILGSLWTNTTLEECKEVLLQYQFETFDAPRLEMRQYDCRHDSLLFLVWLIDGWPNSLGVSIGRDILWRSLNRPRNRLSHHVLPRWKGHPWSPGPHDFAPEIMARLRKLLEP